MRPAKSLATCWAVVGLGFVLVFAEGAARGRWESWMSARASGLLGMRAAKVGWPAVTSSAIRDPLVFGRRMLSGPGQNSVIRSTYIRGIGSVPANSWVLSGSSRRRSISREEMCTIRGLSLGRCLAL